MLNDFLAEGCGAARENFFMCLQEYDHDPLLRVCCGWHKECRAKKELYREQILANKTRTEAFEIAYTNTKWEGGVLKRIERF